jgi:peroxiredoxin
MKIIYSSLLYILMVIYSCTSHPNKNSKNFTLQGEINGQDTGKITLLYVLNDAFVLDTANINNGKFVFNGKILEPTEAELNGGNELNRVFVYLESGKLTIALSKDEFNDFKMIGSKTQNEADLLKKMEEPIYERLLRLKEQGKRIGDSIKISDSGPAKLLLEKKRKVIDSLWSMTSKELDPIELKFVLENPKSFLTPFNLRRLEEKEAISIDSVKSIFNGLDNSIKISRYGKFISEDIRKKENTLIGAQAPDFKATDYNQQTVTLSQFKGKSVVILDFWASWCYWCRKSTPHLKTVYNKYHSKGLDVIAVSVDEKRNDWIEAIKQDSTNLWYHILVAEKWGVGPITNDDIYQNYYYHGVPYQILIDKNGKIIDHFDGYSKENEELLDKLLSQIFEK